MPSDVSAEPAPGHCAVHRNELLLVGRLTAPPHDVVLPSGAVVSRFRVTVARPPAPRPGGATVDALDCAAWEPRLRAAVAGWPAGALVEVTGSVRRRFRRGPDGPVSRWEVEVHTARLDADSARDRVPTATPCPGP